MGEDTLNYTCLHQPHCEEVPVTIQIQEDCVTVEVPTVSLDNQQLAELGSLLLAIALKRQSVDVSSISELLHGFDIPPELISTLGNELEKE